MNEHVDMHREQIDSLRAEVELLTRERDDAIEQLALRSESQMHKDLQHVMGLHNDTIARAEAAEAALKEAMECMLALNKALDNFWNDPQRPLIHTMRGNTVAALSDAQSRTRSILAALEKNDEPR